MTIPTIPAWLRQHLIDTGKWNADGASRRARLRHHSCGLLVLHGLDADLCAWPAITDTRPLTPVGEALALIQGRHTYAYSTIRHELTRRDRWQIAGQPAGTQSYAHILPEHRCNAEPLPHFQPPAPAKKEYHDEPPY